MRYITDYFRKLHEEKIRYCHWKSNGHLRDALEGKTDLDLLVEKDDILKFRELTLGHGFKEMKTPDFKNFPGMSDYYGFDEETGALYHLHVHEKLVIGRAGVKEYHIPIERFFLKNTKMQDGVIVPIPEAEIMILSLRMLIKCRIKDMAIDTFRIKDIFPKEITDEFTELHGKISKKVLKEMIKGSGIGVGLEDYELIFKAIIDRKPLGVFLEKRRLQNLLKGYLRIGPARAAAKAYWYSIISRKAVKKVFGIEDKKKLSKGILIAFIGADGAGKTTAIRTSTKWLGWKLVVKTYYMGIPKTLLNRTLYYAVSAIKNMHKVLEKIRMGWISRKIVMVADSLYWIRIAYVRRRISQKMQEEKKSVVCMCDRYFLEQFKKMEEPMDGPRIGIWGDWLKETEQKIYTDIPRPDLLIVMVVTSKVARDREARRPIKKLHEQKVEMISSIPDKEWIVKIDADEPLETVLLNVKKEIWRNLP